MSTQQLNSTAACPRETVDRDLHSMCRMLIRPRQAKDSGSRKEGVLGVGLALTLFLSSLRFKGREPMLVRRSKDASCVAKPY